jgi:hypothetical protein
MAWKKSPRGLVGIFTKATPKGTDVQSKQMFGYPACFVGGNMFMGLYEESFVLRLSESDRSVLRATAEARPFEPMPGRPMKEYVVLSPSVVADAATVRAWVDKALAYGRSLPVKATAKANSKKRAPAAPAKKPSLPKRAVTMRPLARKMSTRTTLPPPRGRKQSGTVKKAEPHGGR